MKPILKRLLRWSALFAAICLMVGVIGYWQMKAGDAQHEKFYNSGKAIGAFLKDYAARLKEAQASGDFQKVMALYHQDYQSPKRGAMVFAEPEMVGNVKVQELGYIGMTDFGRAEIERELMQYLAGIAVIDNIETKIDLIEALELGKDARLTVKFIIEGRDPGGQLFEDRFFFRWQLQQVDYSLETGGWQILNDALVQGVRVISDVRTFADLNPSSVGLDYQYEIDPRLDRWQHSEKLNFDMIPHVFGGVSSADYNGDGRPDLFFADGKASALYSNETTEKGMFQFMDRTTAAGLSGIGEASAAVFADIDNDGDQDLFISRYLAQNLFYLNNGDGSFTDATVAMGLDFQGPSLSITVLDYNRDGFLDIYVAQYGDAFRAFPRLPFYASNGFPNLLYRNEGGKGFTEVGEAAGVAYQGWSMAVAAGDYDGDGWVDLACANDFGHKNLFRNKGDGSFEDVTLAAGCIDFSAGMGLAFADFNDDGLLDLYTSNIKSNQRWYGEDLTLMQWMRNFVRSKWLFRDMGEVMDLYAKVGDGWRSLGQETGEGNSLFYNKGDGRFRELKQSNTNQAGWGWSVAAFDFDNDMDQDIYAANGWISATPQTDL